MQTLSWRLILVLALFVNFHRYGVNKMSLTNIHSLLLQCLGQQQARLHARYVFARLLQRVDGFDLASESQPHGTLPRTAAWLAKEGTDGRHGKERIWPAATITLHAKVLENSAMSKKVALIAFLGWTVG